jgi:multimeric flavodoxin WrbA
MKIVAFNGSPRKDGNTVLMIKAVIGETGCESEIVHLYDMTIAPCRGCFGCKGIDRCVMDDGLNDCLEKMACADAILLGSPVYSADVSAVMKAFLERAGAVIACNPGLIRHKVGASVAAVRRGGGMSAVDTMNHFFLNKEAIIPGSTYWNMVYGKEPGDSTGDREGMDNMRNLGRNIRFLLDALHQ